MNMIKLSVLKNRLSGMLSVGYPNISVVSGILAVGYPNISVVSGILSVGYPSFSVVSGILSVVGIPPVPIPIPEEIQLLMYDMCPLILKILSTSASEAGTLRKFFANLAISGNLYSLFFQKKQWIIQYAI